MKKMFLAVVGLVVILVAAGLYYLFTNLDAIVEAAIEKYGSQVTQTPVRVDRVRINLADGASEINGLTIANPKGFDMANAFSLGKISVKINIKSVTESPIVIDEIIVKAPEVFYEINAERKGSLDTLLDNIMASVPSGPATTTEQSDKSAKKGDEPRIRIRRFQFADATLNAKIVPLKDKEYTLKIPAINMDNLGGKKGATGEELAKEIMSRLTKQIVAVIKQKGLDAELEKYKAQARQKVEEEKARLKARTDEKIDEQKSKATDKLKGLIKR
ncbi:MAG: hypothetical protein OEY67_00310 [Gammaproteobacteria bacterium]|nr:hypothetical protein [Gammaproteobacteria bacterium]